LHIGLYCGIVWPGGECHAAAACVKSLVTIALTVVFCRLAVTGAVSAQQFLTIFTVVISFYFGTQVERRSTGG